MADPDLRRILGEIQRRGGGALDALAQSFERVEPLFDGDKFGVGDGERLGEGVGQGVMVGLLVGGGTGVMDGLGVHVGFLFTETSEAFGESACAAGAALNQ